MNLNQDSNKPCFSKNLNLDESSMQYSFDDLPSKYDLDEEMVAKLE
jgi:hypothetical protein